MENKKIISNQPPKGTSDWLPEEFEIRNYIFTVWREVCTRFGYKEYLTPIVESADVYRAKSGEDIGGKELVTFEDRGGRELSIRPEMTPSVTRMVSRIYEQTTKPIRLFSIANFMRNEKPQRGRNREFWQLNFDVFGSDSINADIEIATMALELILAFDPPENSFTLYFNNRYLIDYILDDIVKVSQDKKVQLVRLLDKWEKLTEEKMSALLHEIGLEAGQIKSLSDFMTCDNQSDLLQKFPEVRDTKGYQDIVSVMQSLERLGYKEWIAFKPNVIRGFDYYDGMVFEAFDNHPDNNRSMFGGGRYNGLAEIFGAKSFPGVGMAPGDETFKLFLESWGLIPQMREELKTEKYYLPLLDEGLILDVQDLALDLRLEGKTVVQGFDVQKVGKSIEYADKNDYSHIVLFGSQEKSDKKYKIKNLKTGEEVEKSLEE